VANHRRASISSAGSVVGAWLVTSDSELPIVSGGYLKYSHSCETATGVRVRSAVRGRSLAFCEKFSGQDDI
jgi:hypothetical protein